MSIQSITQKLDRIDEARAKATQGEWRHKKHEGIQCEPGYEVKQEHNLGTNSYRDFICMPPNNPNYGYDSEDYKNAEFITLSANEITKLTSALRVALEALGHISDESPDALRMVIKSDKAISEISKILCEAGE